MPELCIMWTAL